MKAAKTARLALFVAVLSLLAPAARAQKSLSDGVDELASKLSASFGEGKKGRVAIVPLRELAGSENLLGTFIAETLTNSFFNVGYRDIVERQMLDRAVQELKLKFTGMIDSESAKKIGKFLHADFVVGGTMTELTGDIVVTCRMFAVETGEVVAVAQTRLVKDDNVKSMMARKIGSATGSSPSSSSADSTGQGETAGKGYTQEASGVSFHLRSCTGGGNAASCELAITALTDDAVLVLLGFRTRLIDSKGDEIPIQMISAGGKSSSHGAQLKLARGIAMIVRLRFEGVDANESTVRLIELGFNVSGVGSGTLQFRNVPLGGRQ